MIGIARPAGTQWACRRRVVAIAPRPVPAGATVGRCFSRRVCISPGTSAVPHPSSRPGGQHGRLGAPVRALPVASASTTLRSTPSERGASVSSSAQLRPTRCTAAHPHYHLPMEEPICAPSEPPSPTPSTSPSAFQPVFKPTAWPCAESSTSGRPRNVKLERDGDGSWQATVALGPGRTYRYRYLLDGQRWENAWLADGYVPNPYGSDDSLVVVE